MILLDDALVQRIHDYSVNILTACSVAAAALHPDHAPTLLKVGDGLAVYAGEGSPFTQAFAHSLTPDDLKAIEEFYGPRTANWEITMGSLMSRETVAAIVAAGYVPHHFETQMVRQTVVEFPVGAGITVDEVDSRSVVWREISHKGWSGTDHPDKPFDDSADFVARTPGVRLFLASVGGKPAGASSMYEHNGLVSLMGGTVAPSFRGRGVQQAMIARRLDEAGPGAVVLMTAMAGTSSYRNAQKAGFGALYSNLIMTRHP